MLSQYRVTCQGQSHDLVLVSRVKVNILYSIWSWYLL